MPYVATRLGRLFYEVSGAATTRRPVVLLHGLFLEHDLWRYQLPALREGQQVYAFDLPGHGHSDVPPAFDLDAQADAFAQALHALGLQQAILVGLSWGGMLAMRVALRHPECVFALGLLSTSAEAEPAGLRRLAGALSGAAERVGVAPRLFDWRIAPVMYGAIARQQRPELVAAAKSRVLRMNRTALARTVDAVITRRESVLGRLHLIRVPTLVICGDRDALTPLRRSERIVREIPHAELEVLPRTGHLSCEESPQEVTQLLQHWLARLAAP